MIYEWAPKRFNGLFSIFDLCSWAAFHKLSIVWGPWLQILREYWYKKKEPCSCYFAWCNICQFKVVILDRFVWDLGRDKTEKVEKWTENGKNWMNIGVHLQAKKMELFMTTYFMCKDKIWITAVISERMKPEFTKEAFSLALRNILAEPL